MTLLSMQVFFSVFLKHKTLKTKTLQNILLKELTL